jgi:hypothetical protein
MSDTAHRIARIRRNFNQEAPMTTQEPEWEAELAESFQPEDHDEDQYGFGQDHWLPSLQELIDSGQAWQLEGSIGRECMDCIESGDCILGEVAHTDYWGNRVPSRHDVLPGTLGSEEYARERQENR